MPNILKVKPFHSFMQWGHRTAERPHGWEAWRSNPPWGSWRWLRFQRAADGLTIKNFSNLCHVSHVLTFKSISNLWIQVVRKKTKSMKLRRWRTKGSREGRWALSTFSIYFWHFKIEMYHRSHVYQQCWYVSSKTHLSPFFCLVLYPSHQDHGHWPGNGKWVFSESTFPLQSIANLHQKIQTFLLSLFHIFSNIFVLVFFVMYLQVEYLIKWWGFDDPKEDTWEPLGIKISLPHLP